MAARRKPVLDRRVVLEQLLSELQGRLHGAEDTALAGLSREVRQVAAELDGLPLADGVAPTDEISKRREERRRKAATG